MMFLSTMVNRILWKTPFINSIHINNSSTDLKIWNHVHLALGKFLCNVYSPEQWVQVPLCMSSYPLKTLLKFFYNLLLIICYYKKNIPLSFYIDFKLYIKLSLMGCLLLSLGHIFCVTFSVVLCTEATEFLLEEHHFQS